MELAIKKTVYLTINDGWLKTFWRFFNNPFVYMKINSMQSLKYSTAYNQNSKMFCI